MICLVPISKKHPNLLANMKVHYSQPNGFVGRSICYAVMYEMRYYGAIVGGSTPKHLAGRDYSNVPLNSIVNNLFFHVNGPYLVRNFTKKVLQEYRRKIELDWYLKYGDFVEYHETLVELPRTGECYRRDGWRLIGQTKGYTCKRVAGKGTDSWGGKRVWDTENLRPKLVFSRKVN